MAREFPARQRGYCAAGDDWIVPGELIKRSGRNLHGSHPQFEHAVCPTTDDPATARPACPSCRRAHAGECA